MRLVIAALAVASLMLTGGLAAPVLAAAGLQQPGQYDINVDVNTHGSAWWTNPVWIGAGAVLLILLIVIIALATRGGGGTTVIKE